MARLQPEDCLQTNSPIHTDRLTVMLEREGFEVRPAKGDHFKYKHPEFPWIQGGLVFHAKSSVYQHEAANACLLVRAERENLSAQSLQPEWENSATPIPLEDQIPDDKFEIIGQTDTALHVRYRKSLVIGMGVPLDSTPKQVASFLTELEKSGEAFRELLGRCKSQHDYEYQHFSDGSIALAHRTYNSVRIAIVPYTMNTLDSDPIGQLRDLILEVGIRDHIFEEYMDYIESLPFISGVRDSQTEKKGDLLQTLQIHDPAKLWWIEYDADKTQHGRAPLGRIAFIFEEIYLNTAQAFQAKSLRNYRGFKTTREGDRLRGEFAVDPDITFNIPLISYSIPSEFTMPDKIEDLPIEAVEKLFKKARAEIDMVAEAYNQFIDANNRVTDHINDTTPRLRSLKKRLEEIGFKSNFGGKTVGQTGYYRFSGPIQIAVEGYTIQEFQDPKRPPEKGMIFSRQALADAEQTFREYLETTADSEPETSGLPFAKAQRSTISDAIRATIEQPPADLPDFLRRDDI